MKPGIPRNASDCGDLPVGGAGAQGAASLIVVELCCEAFTKGGKALEKWRAALTVHKRSWSTSEALLSKALKELVADHISSWEADVLTTGNMGQSSLAALRELGSAIREVDITTDAKSVKTRVERRTLGKSSLDLVIPIREHGDRLHLHWVRSHQTLENHCKEFGTLSKWRWLANAEADKFQTRDLEWEEQLKSKDKANKLVLHFLAERTALLFSHDKDQGPQVQFEGEVASPSKQARPAGLNRKGKLPPKSKEVLSGEADWPNKRDLKGCSVQPAPGTCVAVDFGASKWGPKCKLGAQQILPSQPDRVLDMAVRRSFIRLLVVPRPAKGTVDCPVLEPPPRLRINITRKVCKAMESKPSWIKAWLASIDPNLDVYASKFDDFGYDSENLLAEATKEELEGDLQEMSVKKVHARMILKHHAILQQKLPVKDACAPPPTSSPATESWDATAVQQLLPCMAHVLSFQRLGMAIRSSSYLNKKSEPTEWCMINPEMAFSSGDFKDHSMLELFFDLVSGRKSSKDIQPLDVVVAAGKLEVVSGSRRLTILNWLQAQWKHIAVHAPCYLFAPGDPKVASRYRAKDTSTGGTGILLHPGKKEAKHLHRALFRCPEEWVDKEPEAHDRTLQQPIAVNGLEEQLSATHMGVQPSSAKEPKTEQSDLQMPAVTIVPGPDKEHARSEHLVVPPPPPPPKESQEKAIQIVEPPTFVCCLWLGRRCPEADSHMTAGKRYLHEDVPGMMCGFEFRCRDRHYERPGMSDSGSCLGQSDAEQAVEMEQEEEVVCCHWLQNKCWLKAHHRKGKTLFLHQDVPGLPCTFGDKCRLMHRTVRPVAPSATTSSDSVQDAEAEALPENTFVCCFWLEGKCFHSSHHWLGKKFFLHKDVSGLPCGFGDQCAYMHYETRAALSGDARADVTAAEDEEGSSDPYSADAFVCCLWLEGKCRQKTDHMQGKYKFLHRDVPGLPCGFQDTCKYKHYETRMALDVSMDTYEGAELAVGMLVFIRGRGSVLYGEVLEISASACAAEAPVKVRCEHDQILWCAVRDLQVPDYKLIQKGMSLDVSFGSLGFPGFKCTVLAVSSEARRVKAPVHVRYNGHSSEHDEWVGADRLRSKALKFMSAEMPKSGSTHQAFPPGLGEVATSPSAASGKPSMPLSATTKSESHSETPAEVPGKALLHLGMIVHDTGSGVSGEILEISLPTEQVKVRQGTKTSWILLKRLRVPDYSCIRVGMHVQVLHSKPYLCTVLEVSQPSDRSIAPVHVRYNGYGSEDDEWVGADRLRSKAFKLLCCKLPSAIPGEPCAAPEALRDRPNRWQTAASRLEKAAQESRLPRTVEAQTSGERHEALPWHEREADDDNPSLFLDLALEATSEAVRRKASQSQWQESLESKLQAAAASPLVMELLNHYGWRGGKFEREPDVQRLHEHFRKTRTDLFEVESVPGCCSDDASSAGEGPDLPADDTLNDAASSCAMHADTLDAQLEGQANSIQRLTGTLICGTFRCVGGSSEGKGKHCGEVIVERGPLPLLGCKVRIAAGKNRGHARDCDRCYVRILLGQVFTADGTEHRMREAFVAHDISRTQLYGRIVLSREFGIPRQKLFVCSKCKKSSHERCVAFKPINGKLPPIQVSWPKGSLPPSSSDLHVVEVRDWEGDRQPRGKFIESFQMHSRKSDAAILEPVQMSMNCGDWERGQVRQMWSKFSRAAIPLPDVSSRTDLRTSGPTVGIQHPSLPTSVAVSCIPDALLHIHVLDVNAYLASLESAASMELQELLLRRAVGCWFMNHEDKALEANLPLFPPDIEKELTFAQGSERLAVTFAFRVTDRQTLDLDSVQVLETVVRCDSVLTPHDAGSMILGDADGGEVGTMLRLLAVYAWNFENAEIDRGSLAVFEHLDIDLARQSWDNAPSAFAQLVSCRMMRTLMHIVDRHAGTCLKGLSWSGVMDSAESSAGVTVKYSHGKADPSTWKVLERLFRLKPAESQAKITVRDAVSSLMEILKQPGLSYMQQHCFQSSFVRRMRNAFPQAYYELLPVQAEAAASTSAGSSGTFFKHEHVFHVTAPLQRNLDILGMRALKCHLDLSTPTEHMRLSKEKLQEAVARTNARTSAHNFGLHIFRVISWMKELSPGRRVSNALIGAVGPSYINVLMPTSCAHVLELKVPVWALCGDSGASEYDVATQSLKLTLPSGSYFDQLMIKTWHSPAMVCTIARNCAQPIPHHASANAVIVTELQLQQLSGTNVTFAVGDSMFPQMFSSCTDLKEWAVMDRRLEDYSQLWSRIRTCQVHAAAVCSSVFRPHGGAREPRWREADRKWCFQCRVDVFLAEGQWLYPGDLAVLSCEREDRILELRGVILEAKVDGKCGDGSQHATSFTVEVELSQNACFLKESCACFSGTDISYRMYFISVPLNEKKSILLLKSIPDSPPLQAMRLTVPRSAQQQKRESEMRPLLTVNQVNSALAQPEYSFQSRKEGLNEKQSMALKRGLQRPFSMVQGPPGTGKTSLLVQYVVIALSTMRRNERILVVAPSNQAVDHLLQRLSQDTGIPAHYITRVYSRSIEKEHGSTYKATFNSERAERKFDVRADLEEYALHFKMSQPPYAPRNQAAQGSRDQKTLSANYEKAEELVLKQSRIVLTTCTNGYLHAALSRIWFHTVVIDEAAQASEPDVVLNSTWATHRLVVVGDHQQLGPVVPEMNLDPAYVLALETPFLERMMQNPCRLKASTMLEVQYRMHQSIRSFPSSQFYESRLLDGVAVSFRPKLTCLWPQENDHRLFVDCQTPQIKDRASSEQHTKSLKNPGEAEVVAAVCSALLGQGCVGTDIAILTPYTSQQHEIRFRLELELGKDKSASILVGTVHALQGSEREYIILSFVRSISDEIVDIKPSTMSSSKGDARALRELKTQQLGIVKNRKLLNVALTRPKYGLAIIGNADVLSGGSNDFLDLITSLQSCSCVVDREAFLAKLRGNRVANPQNRRSLPEASVVRPEDSASNIGMQSHISQEDVSECSAVSKALSSISVLSESGVGPKCFLLGTLLPAASGAMIKVEHVGVGHRICAAGSSHHSLQVIHVQRYENEWTEIVKIETDSGASIVVTATHRIVMQNGRKTEAAQVREGDLVKTTGGLAQVISVARHAGHFNIFQVTFSPDEAVEAVSPPADTIWTLGARQVADDHRRTRRSGMNRRPGFRPEGAAPTFVATDDGFR
ncbi:Regulator of nonsense transcripts 1-like [Symbiodinium microadriaticum]|uniref:Regulator of nonsense transcripts 1-like n=1 Tax=Symbiodinium microadriaticum TaxID=2951 RepID=A0A1Q9F710_SYMMI|nr:Regulator of nonsense transcripts 1-like [Symbiodinium microadriaticum]